MIFQQVREQKKIVLAAIGIMFATFLWMLSFQTVFVSLIQSLMLIPFMCISLKLAKLLRNTTLGERSCLEKIISPILCGIIVFCDYYTKGHSGGLPMAIIIGLAYLALDIYLEFKVK